MHNIWVAESVMGSSIGDTSPRPRIEINLTEMKVLGNDGCNNYNGIIEKLNDTALVIGTLALTKKMCPDMAIPNDYNQALARARSYKLNELNLTLLDESGTELISFKKGDKNR